MLPDEMYKRGSSLTEVSDKTGIHKSTLRYRFMKLGILRSVKEAIILAGSKGKMDRTKFLIGRFVSKETRKKMSISKTARAKGVSLKPSGYIEHTMGENKFRSVHVVIMEGVIGRKIKPYECVHHLDENKQNNNIENLQLMTKSEHAKHHANLNRNKRKRDKKGRYNNERIK